MKNFYVNILGCQQNEHDGVRIKYLLEKLGMVETDRKSADLIVIVACSVRQTAVDRVFGVIRNFKDKKILVAGCVLDSDKTKFEKRGVKFWDINKPETLKRLLKIRSKQSIAALMRQGERFSSSVPIMFGCNNFCTYCATAFTRGRERSRKFEEIVKDVEKLVCAGYKEILLLGQTINSYKDNETGQRLDDLFKRLNEIDGDFVISFTSNHPKDMTDKIIRAVSDLPKIKKEIHLPLQSGSDTILKAMNRPYSVKQYLEVIKKIKNANNNIAITTDVIVGFPGESEQDFQRTVKVFQSVGYRTAYINKYSPRPGTAAFKLGDPIPWEEKQRRWRILNDIVRNSTQRSRQ